MGYLDDILEEMHSYRPALTKQADFDLFWEQTLQENQNTPLNPIRKRVDYPIRSVEVNQIEFNGMDGTPIHGWFIVPTYLRKDKYPCLIHYHGFGGSKGHPSQFMHWAMLGFAVLSIDCREQGGRTGNLSGNSGSFVLNVASKGVHNKDEYYFRSVYMDCIKAIDFACEQAEVDTAKIVIEGGSQGGGLGMAIAALDDRPILAMVDVPSNSNLVKRIEGNHGAFSSVAEYLKIHPGDTDLVLDNLSYFDTMNMADRITCRVYASVGLKDETCPPQMYFATYNRIQSEKEIVLYPFNGHEGGGPIHTEKKMAYVRECYPTWFE